MIHEFEQDGIRFRYPAGWTLEREDSDEGWTVSLQGPETAFLTLTCDAGMPDREEMTEAALAALRSDYPDLESETAVETLAGQPAIGHDINFFSLDLPITCWTRSFFSSAGTVLVLCQASDLELEHAGPILRAICASLRVEDD
jgi:hypothetical protein